MTDTDTIAAIASGDTGAFARWMVGAEPTIRLSLRSFAAAVDVEAVVQETLLRVWQVAPRFEHDGKPNGLLRLGVRIARNLAISEVRKARTRSAEDDELERRLADGTTGVAAPDPLLRGAIAECRDQLPDAPKRALAGRLASAGRDRDVDVAARVGMRKNTFLQNITRARTALRRCLEARGIALELVLR